MTHVDNKGSRNRSFATSNSQYSGPHARAGLWRSGLRIGVVVAVAGLVFGCGTPGVNGPSGSSPTSSQGSSDTSGSGSGTGTIGRPTVSITAPTSGAPYTSPGSTVTITGTATDDVGVSRVTWTNSLGGSGTASGTTNWSANAIPLQQGQNIITVTAFDSAQNSGALSFIVYFNTTAGNTYYVATTGSDLSGNGSSANPWKTIGYGIGRMASGDTLIVKKGVYSGRANFVKGMPSGTPGRYTTIMAEAPMEVRIQNATSETLANQEYMLNVPGPEVGTPANYVKVDGFIFNLANSLYPPHNGSVGGDYNKITRSIFRRAGVQDNWGGLLSVGGNYNLVEDVAGVGTCRYCFEQGGPNAVVRYNIWRRVVGRFDYSGSDQPKRTMTTYGNDGFYSNGDTGVRDHLYQNVIALDGNDVDTQRRPGEVKYSAIGVGKAATNVTFQGAIVLNENAAYAGIFASTWGRGNVVNNSVIWDLAGVSSPNGIRADNANTTVDHVTIGGAIPGTYYLLSSSPATPLLSALGGTTYTNLLNNTPGAVIVKRYGVSGTLWGEPGYNSLTNDDLWPWPYEDKIKAVFAERNDPPAGYAPPTNNTTRGFAAPGNGLYGGPITLTSYIWEYLGTPCPSNVCPQ